MSKGRSEILGDPRKDPDSGEGHEPAPPDGPPSDMRVADRPIDLAIPTRVRRASVDGAPLRAAFLLSHVDDRTPLAQIAASAQIPRPEAIESFLLLVDLGLIELRYSAPPSSRRQATRSDEGAEMRARKSGLIAKTTPK